MALPAGSRLGSYEVLSPLGAGGMGEVYRARDIRLGREVAIKVLPADRLADENRRRRFVQEARAASSLNHPHIVTIHEIESAGDADFIVMEYVRGRSLDALIPRSGMRLGELLRIAIPVADAFAAAHARGIIHRDLKPANVMVGHEGAVKVLDFGLAKLIGGEVSPDDETLTHLADPGVSAPGAIAGTAAYMAPEQAAGGKVDARSDVFSFGAMVYEMATGTRAFAAGSTAETLAAVVRAQPKPPAQIVQALPRELDRLILRCLRKEPDRRYQTMLDVKIELEEIKEESDTRSATPVPVTARGHRARTAAGVGLALAILAAAIWLLRPPPSHDAGPPEMTIVPLTTMNGSENFPTFAPDGDQVAFVWNGETQDNDDIYVKMVGEVEARRLTTDPARDASAAWSPDGRHIAFVRVGSGGNRLRLVSPFGGADRKLSDVAVAAGTIAWSPDSRWVAAAGDLPDEASNAAGRALYLFPVHGGGERRRLTQADPGRVVRSPAFSFDGRRLAYAQCSGPVGTSCEVRVMALGPDYEPAGAARRITTKPHHLLFNVAWTPDGTSVVYSALSSPGMEHLWRVAASGAHEPERIEVAGSGAFGMAIAPTRDRLAFSRRLGGIGIHRFDPAGPSDSLIVSSATASVWDYHPDFSPDGSRIAFSSTRSGANQIWLAAADGSNARQLTHGPGVWQGSAAWSPDGRTIAFDSRRDDGRWSLWTIDSDGAAPRQLASDPGDQNMPTWSRDGRWIYFSSTNGGTRNIWRVPAAGGPSERLTQGGSGMWAHESHDGTEILYQPRIDDSPLRAQPLAGGPARQVAPCVGGFRGFDVRAAGIYYMACGNPPAPVHLLDPRSGRDRVLGPGPTLTKGEGFAVSPDGKTILIAQYSSTSPQADLMLIENFR